MNLLMCLNCGEKVETNMPKYKCGKCGGPLEYKIEYESIRNLKFTGEISFWRYRLLLPKVKNMATLREGGTPLYKANRLADQIGLPNLYLKDETRNPTNSFRDRAAALMVSNMLDLGFSTAICASNGNMGASLAAYCAKYGLTCHVIIPRNIEVGKIAQMIVYDAIVEEYGATVDESIARAERLAEETGWYQATSALNPLVIEAQKTIAYEIAEQLGNVPDVVIVPMGSGGTIYSLWKGFRELYDLDRIKETPKLIGVQSNGCPPIVNAYVGRDEKLVNPATMATSIFVLNPLKKELAVKAIKESGGVALTVSDDEILKAEQEIARTEGLFAEPASSGTIAALKKLLKASAIDKSETVVCLITGSGLKVTDILEALHKKRKMAVIGAEFSTKEKILRIISKKKTYGYEIWKELGKTMTRTAIYQHLNELQSKGLITIRVEGGRKYFSITERGKRILEALNEIKALL